MFPKGTHGRERFLFCSILSLCGGCFSILSRLSVVVGASLLFLLLVCCEWVGLLHLCGHEYFLHGNLVLSVLLSVLWRR